MDCNITNNVSDITTTLKVCITTNRFVDILCQGKDMHINMDCHSTAMHDMRVCVFAYA